MSQAHNMMSNIYGPLHPDIALCLRLMARMAFALGVRTYIFIFAILFNKVFSILNGKYKRQNLICLKYKIYANFLKKIYFLSTMILMFLCLGSYRCSFAAT